MTPLLRPATPADAPALAEIYADAVRHGTATYELDPPDAAEMAVRLAAVTGQGYPWIVAERDGRVAAYAYASAFRARPAYRFLVEDSIYVAPAAKGAGLGRTLLDDLLARCTAAGFRQMLAVIGGADHAASIRLHRAAGFADCGVLHGSGRKFDRWLDTVLMQRPLGPGDTTAPDEAALPAPLRRG